MFRAVSHFFSAAIASTQQSPTRSAWLIWFARPFFLGPAAIRLEEMELVNALCRLAEYADREVV